MKLSALLFLATADQVDADDHNGQVPNPFNNKHHFNVDTYEGRGARWKQFYESMDPQASGEELRQFWQKHAELKKELGTNDSYHKGFKTDDEDNQTNNYKKENAAQQWAPIIALQVEGKLAEAWELMKKMPKIQDKLANGDEFMKKYWDENEAGNYEAAHDMMLQYKIQTYGPLKVKSWGYDISKYMDQPEMEKFDIKSSPWWPIVQLQVAGKLEDAWTQTKVLPEFLAKMNKENADPFYQKYWDMNEAGNYQEAFDYKMKHKIATYGPEMVANWGYDVSPYVDDVEDLDKSKASVLDDSAEVGASEYKPWSHRGGHGKPHIWHQVHSLKAEGKHAEAWEMMKAQKTPEMWKSKFDGEHGDLLRQAYELNEAGSYEEADKIMMDWKAKMGWGKHHHHGPHGGYDLMKKGKEIIERMRENGMLELGKKILDSSLIEDTMTMIDSMGGIDAMVEKLKKYSNPSTIAEMKQFKQRERSAFTVTTQLAASARLTSMFTDQTHRRTMDEVAKLNKELPVGSTCASLSEQLNCAMESYLVQTPYDNEAPWPHELLEGFFKAGILTPQGPGTQGVAYMPNISDLLSVSDDFFVDKDAVAAVATVTGSGRLALTSGRACLYPMLEDYDVSELNWDFSNANEFHQLNKPINLTEAERELLAIKLHGMDLNPVQRMLVPVSLTALDIVADLQTETDPDRLKQLKLDLGEATQCALLFDQNLPTWPTCNPLDNGQFAYAMWKEKQVIMEQSEHVWGEKRDIDPVTLSTLNGINHQLVDVRYRKALAKMDIPCLHRAPKQCFIVFFDPKSNEMKTYPMDVLDYESCAELYGAPACKTSYFAKCDVSNPVEYLGAPMLCAEHGSVTLRAIAGKMIDETYRQFHAGDYNIAAVGAHMLNNQVWQSMITNEMGEQL